MHCPRFNIRCVVFFILLNYLDKCSATLTIQWPAGQYGLPMPVSGCPSANFSWLTGWRHEDTEDKKPSNRRSDYLHIKGFVGLSSVNKSFCMKTDLSQDSLQRVWPKGKYCIYKKGTYCPQGLNSGLVTWDDEDSENTNSQSGVLPEGHYEGSRTTIQYCCSVNGVKTNPISLPVDTPFYLFAYESTQCQQVQWALATREWIHYDTENGVNSDAKYGDYPYGVQGGVDGHTIHYCYYTSCRYVFNSSSGTFQSPGFPNEYPSGQLCSWRITVQTERIVTLRFTNFSMATSSHGDVIQIYDGNDDNATLLASYHGDSVAGNVKSSSNSLYMIFRSNSVLSGRGFRASYLAVDPKEPVQPTNPLKPETEPTSDIRNQTSTQDESSVLRKSCLQESSSKISVASIVVPTVCLIMMAVLSAFMLYRWRTIRARSRKKTLSVIYQAKTVSNPSYFGATVANNNSNYKREDEVSIATKEEGNDDIYQEVSEKRIDNPLYDSQDDLHTGNPLYQGSDATSNNTLYDSIPYSQ